MDHINDKLLNLNDLMRTETAKRLAEEQHRYLCVFLETLPEDITIPVTLPNALH